MNTVLTLWLLAAAGAGRLSDDPAEMLAGIVLLVGLAVGLAWMTGDRT